MRMDAQLGERYATRSRATSQSMTWNDSSSVMLTYLPYLVQDFAVCKDPALDYDALPRSPGIARALLLYGTLEIEDIVVVGDIGDCEGM